MPVLGRLESSDGGTLDPLSCVEVVIPLFPVDCTLTLNTVSLITSTNQTSSSSSSSDKLSSSTSSPFRLCSSLEENERFLPLDEGSETSCEESLKGDRNRGVSTTEIIPTSFHDDPTDCDIDFEDWDFDSFVEEEGSGQVTSTTSSGTLQSTDDKSEEEFCLENPNPVPCRHCQGGKRNSWTQDLIWPIQLDVDLIETLVELCPQFFDDFDEVEMDGMDFLTSENTSEDPTSTTTTTHDNHGDQSELSGSPPNVQVDDSPLQPSLRRNKESLKVKLLLRRPMNQLVEQGILPPPKTPPAFAGQRVRLERARMGDLLKAKIQQRPARQELIRQHILEECDARVAPSLAEKQRMLKRARLADSLNDHLLHRPGPLELVKKNILHAPHAIIDQAIKEGVVPFKATSEGVFSGPHLPSSIYLSEDESSSDFSSPAATPDQSQSSSSVDIEKTDISSEVQSPTSTTSTNLQVIASPQGYPISPLGIIGPQTPTSTVSPSPVYVPPPPPLPKPITPVQNEILSKIVKAAVTSSTTPPITTAQLTLSKISNFEHQQLFTAVQQSQQPTRASTQPTTPNAFSQNHISSAKARNKKSTSKIKAQPKARQIKFHEYKGPPSAQNNRQQQNQLQEVESSYELLLQQQQLFLQWQLECRQKILLPAVSKLNSPTEVTASFSSAMSPVGAAAMSIHPPSILAPTTSTPILRSPSTISSVTNSNKTGTLGQQPIAPAPPPPMTVQSLVEKYNRNTVSASLPIKINLSHGSATPVTEIRPKLPPTRTLESVNLSSSKSISSLDISKLSDWKVSDLKSELKKRNLPVSGPKPQLIERLKLADASLQDESISSTQVNTSFNGVMKTPVKPEVQVLEESSSNEMMDVGDTLGASSYTPQVNTEGFGKTSNVAALNAAMLTLLQNNNLQNNGVIPVHILNALANVAKTTNMKAGNNGKTQNIVVVDEKLLREQQIEELQQALQNSQTQHQQIKVTQQTGAAGQKHRIALQQHLQQKMQQQALQSQLQKLIQLHSLQQQQQQQQQVQKPPQAQGPPRTGKLINNLQQAHIQILHHHKPQKATNTMTGGESTSTFTLHEAEETDKKSINGLTQGHMTTDQTQNPIHNNAALATLKINKPPHSTPTEIEASEEEGTDIANIPQLQIPELNSAFQTGESDSNHSTKSSSFSSSDDPMDHSWLLKINETPPSDSKKSLVKEFATFFESFANGEKKEEMKLQIPKPRRGFKSQMVDDVLEILIRNGELPPSAAQDPTTPTTPGKSPRVLPYPTHSPSLVPSASTTTSSEDASKSPLLTPPPPPPLPPPTFAVTLPTTITFSRSSTANPLLPQNRHIDELKLTPESMKGPPPPYPTEKDALSKEAQDILKISQDLSNFGKAHYQNDTDVHTLYSATNEIDYDSNTLAMLLDEVEKEGMGRMEMEMDTVNQHFQHVNHDTDSSVVFQNAFHSKVNEEQMSVGNGASKHQDLLEEFLLPTDLDVSMPMEMEYSDWLEDFLPHNHQSSEVFQQNPEIITTSPNNNTNSNFFMDYNSEGFGNRDPLLSSRAFNIFGGENETKSNRAQSPMAIGETSLWDFV